MSFHKPRASSDRSFNSESPMRWLVIGVRDPSTAAPRRAVANLLQGYYGWVRNEELVKILAFRHKSHRVGLSLLTGTRCATAGYVKGATIGEYYWPHHAGVDLLAPH
jgi:hypothetical protein